MSEFCDIVKLAELLKTDEKESSDSEDDVDNTISVGGMYFITLLWQSVILKNKFVCVYLVNSYYLKAINYFPR